MRDKFWRGEYRLDCDPSKFAFPDGRSVEDMVIDVLHKVLEETRTWDSSRFPEIMPVLKGMISSEINNTVELDENKKAKVLSSTTEDGETTFDFETNVDAHHAQIDTSTRLIPSDAMSHPGAGASADEYSDELYREVSGDSELEAVLLAINYGAEKAKDVAESTGIAIARVYELNRKLDALADKITKRVALRRLLKNSAKQGGK